MTTLATLSLDPDRETEFISSVPNLMEGTCGRQLHWGSAQITSPRIAAVVWPFLLWAWPCDFLWPLGH